MIYATGMMLQSWLPRIVIKIGWKWPKSNTKRGMEPFEMKYVLWSSIVQDYLFYVNFC